MLNVDADPRTFQIDPPLLLGVHMPKIRGIPRLIILVTVTGVVMLLGPPTAVAAEVYRWVDNKGVVHYSQWKPSQDGVAADAELPAYDQLSLPDTRPADYDPEDDPFNVAATAEAISEVWEDLDEKRERRRQEALNAQPTVVNYPVVEANDGYPYLFPAGAHYPGHRPKPRPPRPKPPVAPPIEPPVSFPFRKP